MARMLMTIGGCGWMWAGFWLVVSFWPHSFLPALLVFCAFVKTRKTHLWQHGTAYWADKKALARCITATQGILLGRLMK